jgi:ribosomal protein L12E/L44/L45/RPP1/RPP2
MTESFRRARPPWGIPPAIAESVRGSECQRWRWPGAAIGLLALLSACGDVVDPSTRHVSQPLIGGEIAGEQYDGIVMIMTTHEDDEWSVCTATLVSPRVLVTAKHCVTGVQSGDFYCTGAGELRDQSSGAGMFGMLPSADSMEVFVGASPAREQPVSSGRTIYAMPSEHVCRDDVVAAVLDRPVDWLPTVEIRSDQEVKAGEMVSLVGYGEQEGSNQPVRRVREDIRIQDVGAMTEAEEQANPLTPPNTFTIGGNTVCYGDSGGPALDGDGKLVGILSRLNGDCYVEETRNTYMAVASYLDLIDEAVAEATALSTVPAASSGAAGAPGEEETAAAGAPSSSDDVEPEPTSPRRSSSAFNCQLSGGPSSKTAPTNLLLWACAALMGLCWRFAFAGAASRADRDD